MRPLRCGLGLLLWSCLVSFGQEPPGAEYRQALKQAEDLRARGDLERVVRALLPWVEK